VLTIIGERINSTREPIAGAIRARDAAFIQKEALEQVQAGAHYLDVNAAALLENEPAHMEWLVSTVQQAADVRLCLDSPNAEAIAAGLAAHQGRALVNSISAERARAQAILPLVKRYDAEVIGLTLEEGTMPTTAADRARLAQAVVAIAAEYGVQQERIFIDPLVRCVASEPTQGREVLDATRAISHALPRVRVVCGLSNVSYGLPRRRLLNRTFLAMCMAAGLGAAVLDPLDKHLMSTLRAAEALRGEDEYCLEYLKAHREGRLAD